MENPVTTRILALVGSLRAGSYNKQLAEAAVKCAPDGVDVDIFENLGHENHTLHFTNHWKGADGKPRGKGQQKDGPDYTADFHTIAVDWEPDSIVWYVDDVEQCRVSDNISKEKMYMLLNLAVGGDWPKSPDANTVFPQSYDIDYVRVYQKQ